MARIKEEGNGVYSFKCPGCNSIHVINRKPYNPRGASWIFINKDLDHPTFKPSVKVTYGRYLDKKSIKRLKVTKEDFEFWVKENFGERCHFHIQKGIIKFCGDCTHDKKGQHIELPDIY